MESSPSSEQRPLPWKGPGEPWVAFEKECKAKIIDLLRSLVLPGNFSVEMRSHPWPAGQFQAASWLFKSLEALVRWHSLW